MATSFGQNLQNDLYLPGWCTETARNMAISIQKYTMEML